MTRYHFHGMILLFLAGLPAIGLAEEPTWVERVLQNRLLREHFAEEIWRNAGRDRHRYATTPPYSQRDIPSSLGSVQAVQVIEMEQEIDARIGRLLRQVDDIFSQFSESLETAGQQREHCVRAGSWDQLPKADRKDVTKALETIKKRARELHGVLELIYPSLEAESTGALNENPEADDPCHSRSIESLSREVTQVKEQIRSALAGGFVVIIDELNNSFLVRLDRIARHSDHLRKRIR